MTRHILVHGLGQNAGSWDTVRSLIEGERMFDTPELPCLLADRAVSYENLYRAFEHYCDAFEEPLCLGGLSLGGVLAMRYGIEHPEKVQALVLMATQFFMPKKLLAFQDLMFRFMPETAFWDIGFGNEDFIHLCKTMGALDFSDRLGGVSCPVLVLCGGKDKANLSASKALAQRLPNARLQVIPGSGHELNTQAPEALSRALEDFYREYRL